MGRRRFTDEPPPPDDLRCRRSDGRDWRCPQPSLPGLSLCIYHHRRSYKNPSFSPSPGPSSNPPPATPPTSAEEKKPWKLRIRSSKRPASPSDEGGAMETPQSERTDDQKSTQRRRRNPDPPTSPPSGSCLFGIIGENLSEFLQIKRHKLKYSCRKRLI
jgi:WRC